MLFTQLTYGFGGLDILHLDYNNIALYQIKSAAVLQVHTPAYVFKNHTLAETTYSQPYFQEHIFKHGFP